MQQLFLCGSFEAPLSSRLWRATSPVVTGEAHIPLSQAPVETGEGDRERSTSANHTSLTLVFLGRFRIRSVFQSASSYGLASWTGQQAVVGAQERTAVRGFPRSAVLFVWVATQLRERSERNKNPPAMRVEDKKLYKKHLSRLY